MKEPIKYDIKDPKYAGWRTIGDVTQRLVDAYGPQKLADETGKLVKASEKLSRKILKNLKIKGKVPEEVYRAMPIVIAGILLDSAASGTMAYITKPTGSSEDPQELSKALEEFKAKHSIH